MPFEIFSERKNGETNSKYAYRLLRESIMSFKLLSGEALDETVISEQFGTSRTPVREALILLKNEKLVDILPQKGSKVSFIDLNLVRQGYFTRRVIETAIFKETAGSRKGIIRCAEQPPDPACSPCGRGSDRPPW